MSKRQARLTDMLASTSGDYVQRANPSEDEEKISKGKRYLKWLRGSWLRMTLLLPSKGYNE